MSYPSIVLFVAPLSHEGCIHGPPSTSDVLSSANALNAIARPYSPTMRGSDTFIAAHVVVTTHGRDDAKSCWIPNWSNSCMPSHVASFPNDTNRAPGIFAATRSHVAAVDASGWHNATPPSTPSSSVAATTACSGSPVYHAASSAFSAVAFVSTHTPAPMNEGPSRKNT